MRKKLPEKMALARGVLAWLPLQRLVDLREVQPRLITDQLLYLRLEAVNRLTEEFLPKGPGWPGDLWLRYVELCTYQGEFSTEAVKFLSANALAARAAALRSVAWYRFYSSHDATRVGEPEALKSGDPAIQALFLARYAEGTHSLPTILDPRAWPWTQGLAQVLSELIERKNDVANFQLAGYLQHDPSKTDDLYYSSGALAYYMLRKPDPFANDLSPELQKLSTRASDRFWAGDYHGEKPAVASAFRRLDVRAVQIALQKYPSYIPSMTFGVPIIGGVSEYLCRRAYAMYLLWQSNPSLPLFPADLLDLRALAGLPIAEEELEDPQLGPRVREIMLTVAHPDLRVVPIDRNGDLMTPSSSEVKYDIPNLLRVTASVPGVLSDYQIDDLFRRLYVQGQILAYRRDERFAENFSAQYNSIEPNFAPKEAEVRRIYEILRANPAPL